jgi:hypothetical protein
LARIIKRACPTTHTLTAVLLHVRGGITAASFNIKITVSKHHRNMQRTIRQMKTNISILVNITNLELTDDIQNTTLAWLGYMIREGITFDNDDNFDYNVKTDKANGIITVEQIKLK